ncbi:MAG TPA: hypothetical protein VG943_07140 [Caulobacterales bacterium]|nr:hypothetical protein [Caulobacterales bacterium]
MPVPKELQKQPDRKTVRPDELKAYDRVVGRQTFYGYTKGTPGYPVRAKGEEAGPYFGVLLNAPLIADHLSELGVYYRTRGEYPNSYSHADREWVDIVLGEYLEFNMWGHILDGIAVGVRPEAIFAVLEHREADLTDDERKLAQYIRRLADGALDASDWAYVEKKFGLRGAVEFTGWIGHLLTTIRLLQALMANHLESNEELAARLRKFLADGEKLPDPKARVPKMEYEEQAG